MDQQWLKETLGKGIALLLLLRLKNTPPEDAIKSTLAAWYQVITYKRDYEQKLDQWRFEDAFMYLSQTCEWFPSPKQLLEAMPHRKIIELPPPPQMTEQAREKAIHNMKRLKTMLKGTKVCVKN
ncbi:hypothetical protein FHQ28_08600 [Pasteurellaceae bacterium USgator11]|nr:hypothetical protein FHQ20_11665 [Pasteurellaceae bacterium USgator41]TNG98681.1 hypothetical protein FHQ24_07810 [Pasteurellaceae bacterium UScroc31]TNH00048.1 hypothetical protein FHQ28_08600 [Pasteurellaceae bacterium USgator11]